MSAVSPPALRRTLSLALLFLVACGSGEPAAGPGARQQAAPPAARSAPSVGRPAIVWRRFADPTETVVIGPGGVAMGPAGQPQVLKLFTNRERLADLHHFTRAFAPFSADTPEGPLEFRGRGAAPAGPVEQRMIREWARLVAAEAVGGRGGATSGTALVWHRSGGSGQACGDLVVSLSGEARAVACAAGSGAERGRLSAGRLGRLYAWFDALRPFQAGDAGQDGGAARPVRLIFAGQGSREATPAERREIERFAAEVHGELTARAQPGGRAGP